MAALTGSKKAHPQLGPGICDPPFSEIRETFFVADFVNFKIESAQFFEGAYS
jgi:hypothetical protein